jgi:hypothetical protein
MFVVMHTRTWAGKVPSLSHPLAIRQTKPDAIARMAVLVNRAVDDGVTIAGRGNAWMTTRGTDEGVSFIDTYTVEYVIDCAS